MRPPLAAALALVLTLTGAAARGGAAERSGEKLTLRLRLEKGRTYTRWVRVDQRILQEVDSEEQVIEQRLGLGLSLEVMDVTDEGKMRVRVTIARLLIEEHLPSGEFAYDSAQKKKEVPPQARSYAALVGAAFTATLTPLGRIESVEGLAAVEQRAVASVTSPELRRKLSERSEARLAPERLKAQLALLMGHLPEGAVAPGETWTRRVEGGGGLPLAVETTYTLLSRAAGKATFDVASKTSPLPEASALDLDVAALRPVLRGEGHGRMIVDEATGWVESASVKTKLSGSVRAAINEKENSSWPVLIESTVTIGPLPKEPDE